MNSDTEMKSDVVPVTFKIKCTNPWSDFRSKVTPTMVLYAFSRRPESHSGEAAPELLHHKLQIKADGSDEAEPLQVK